MVGFFWGGVGKLLVGVAAPEGAESPVGLDGTHGGVVGVVGGVGGPMHVLWYSAAEQ